MDIRRINKEIFYVGVNDRTTELFESLWPLPYGVSYNSYIVKGDKVALIDTVLSENTKEFSNNLSKLLGHRKIDFLIVNHMEPDHSSSIPEILALYPEMKIVTNRQAINMIKGFYKINNDDLFMEVKDGESLDLGGYTLKFYMTPMVHWPETMMTYVEEEKLLFSGDAFGTFGALNGGIIDRDLDLEIYFKELYRYYSNIVGKYGKFVQNALKKLSGVELNYVCPTHGPIWNENINEVLAITDRLSKYEGEEGVVIIYGSMYGNTAEVAEEIAREISKRGIKKIIVHNAAHSAMSDMISDAYRYKGLIVGSPTYSMHLFPPIDTFMTAMETREIKNKVFATFGSFTWAPGVVAKSFKEYSEKMNLPIVAELTMKQSIDEDVREEVVNLAETVVNALKEY